MWTSSLLLQSSQVALTSVSALQYIYIYIYAQKAMRRPGPGLALTDDSDLVGK